MFESRSRSLGNAVELTADHIKVHVERHCWKKMYGWCKAANGEVSGMGLVRIDKDKFVVYDVFLPLQYGSTGYTELDDRANARLQASLFKKGVDMRHFRLWWHTHYNFDVFWSGIDDNNAEELARANGDWELSIVINQKGEYRARVDFIKNIHPLLNFNAHYLVDELDVLLIPDSRRHKNNRNYKSDIRKWVRPMSELPESQKPKPIIHTPAGPSITPHDEYAGFGYQDEFWRRGSLWDDSPKPTEHYDRPLWRRRQEEFRRENDKGWVQDTRFGKYYLYKGVLMDEASYKKAKKSDKGPSGVDEDVKGEPGKYCICGNPRCFDQRECVPCVQCGGRFQASTGHCEGCARLAAESKDVTCTCAHTGVWESCTCGQDCFKCLEDEYAARGD